MPLAPKPSAIHKVEYPEYVPISNTFFGHNAVLFCFASYLINTYANAFKLFSYLHCNL